MGATGQNDVTEPTQDRIAATEGAGPGIDHEPVSIGDTLAHVVSTAKDFAAAEIALAKQRGAIIASAGQYIAVLGIAAFIIAFGMIVTLMIGAVLALAPLWGLGLALLAVTGGALLVILLCGVGIKVQVSRIKEGVR